MDRDEVALGFFILFIVLFVLALAFLPANKNGAKAGPVLQWQDDSTNMTRCYRFADKQSGISCIAFN